VHVLLLLQGKHSQMREKVETPPKAIDVKTENNNNKCG
jgi:hypothetical protein